MTPRAHAAFRTLITVLLWLAGGGVANAQSAIRTVIIGEQSAPAPTAAQTFTIDEPVTLSFRTGALPPNATVTAAELQLVAESLLDNAEVRIEVLTLGAGGSNASMFGALTLYPDEPGPQGVATWHASQGSPWFSMVRGGREASIVVSVRRSDASPGVRTRQWYSPKAEETRFRPRLILDYTVPGWTEPRQAVGLTGVAGPRAVVPTGRGFVRRDEVHVLPFPVEKVWSHTPAFGHGLVYLVAGDKSDEARVEARLPLSGALVWSMPAKGAGQHIVLAPSNRLYVVGKDRIFTYVIDPARPMAVPTHQIRRDGQPVFENSVAFGGDINTPPAAGPDGSLYVVAGQTLYALTPDFAQAWSSNLGDISNGPITVDPSGRLIYLLSRTEGLLAFDAQTGTRRAHALTNQQPIKDFANPALHAPVVMTMADGTRAIFLSTTTGNDGSLTLVKDFSLSSIARSDPLVQFGAPALGLWSQVLPVPDRRDFPERDGLRPVIGVLGPVTTGAQARRSHDAKGDAVVAVTSYTGSDTKEHLAVGETPPSHPSLGVTFPQGPDTPIWTTRGRPVIDARGALHLWNGEATYQARNVNGGVTYDYMFPAHALGSGSRLMFGSDGTLYAHNLDHRWLKVVMPTVTLDDKASAVVDAPMHVAVAGHGARGTRITAHGAVAFLPGASLAADTQVRTGAP